MGLSKSGNVDRAGKGDLRASAMPLYLLWKLVLPLISSCSNYLTKIRVVGIDLETSQYGLTAGREGVA